MVVSIEVYQKVCQGIENNNPECLALYRCISTLLPPQGSEFIMEEGQKESTLKADYKETVSGHSTVTTHNELMEALRAQKHLYVSSSQTYCSLPMLC